MTNDRLPMLVTDSERHKLLNAATLLDLTAIYNSHGTAENAAESVQQIDLDSVVYVEGIATEAREQYHLDSLCTDLTFYKRTFGKDDAYYDLRNALIQALDKHIETHVDQGPNDFSLHSFSLYRHLLLKDCDIITADYEHIEDFGEDQDRVDSLSAGMAIEAHKHARDRMYHVQPGDDLEETAFDALYDIEDEYNRFRLREQLAAIAIMNDVTMITDDSRWFMNAPRNSNGKIRAYVTYGTFHAKSLTAKIQQWGVNPKVTQLHEVEAYGYIAKDDEDFEKRAPKLLAIHAFQALTASVFEEFHPDVILTLQYKATDRLVESIDSLEQSVHFAVDCMRLILKTKTDMEGAVEDYEDTIFNIIGLSGANE